MSSIFCVYSEGNASNGKPVVLINLALSPWYLHYIFHQPGTSELLDLHENQTMRALKVKLTKAEEEVERKRIKALFDRIDTGMYAQHDAN